MKSRTQHRHGYTLTEVMVAAAVTAVIAMGILTYATMATRMVARNITVNHSHDAARAAYQRLLRDLHSSASQFTLMNVSVSGGTTTYSDIQPIYSGSNSNTDSYYMNYLINNNRANGVRFFKCVGAFQLTGDGVLDSGTVQSTSSTLEFDFSNSGYVPSAGDALQIPLISGEFLVSGTPTNVSGNKYKVTICRYDGSSATVAYNLYTGPNSITTNTNITYTASSGTYPANTAGYFYERVAYAVVNGQLLYYPNLTDPPNTSSYPCTWTAAATDTPIVIRNNVCSTAPFSLLLSGTTASTVGLYTLRVSLVAYDLNYSARAFQNGAVTLLTIVPPANVTESQTTLSTNLR